MVSKKRFSSLFSSGLDDRAVVEMLPTSCAAKVDGGGPLFAAASGAIFTFSSQRVMGEMHGINAAAGRDRAIVGVARLEV